MPQIIGWKLSEIAEMIKNMRVNKFDCIVAFCGKRGLSKSTGAYKLCLRLRKQDRNLNFRARSHILYSYDEISKALACYDTAVMADEAIYATYKRDFMSREQKDLIRMLNAYRDHRNVLILCIPNFWDLDKAVRDMVKIRIDMVKRGVGIVHRQLPNQYKNDPWDMANNQKIEGTFTKNGIYKPNYSRLSTFVGVLKFNALTPKQEIFYQQIKDEKRNQMLKNNDKEKQTKEEYHNRMFNLVMSGELSKEELVKVTLVTGKPLGALLKGMRDIAKEKGVRLQDVFKASDKTRQAKNIKESLTKIKDQIVLTNIGPKE